MSIRRPLHVLALSCTIGTVLALAPAVGAAATYAPASKQVLRVNVGTLPGSLDPGRASYESDLVVQNALFAPLYRSPAGSAGRLVPYLAARQPVVSMGGLRYTVQLRAARWSDGRPVTAADVKLAYTRARGASYYGTFFDPVRSVTAVGARTVRFDLTQPIPWFGELLASNVVTPVPSHVVRQRRARWTELRYLVTSGPFRVLSGRGRSELVLVRNDRWWGARSVRLRRLELLAISPAAASPLFRANRLDATLRDTSIHPSALASWVRDRRFTTVPTGQVQLLYMNTRAPTLQSPAVRRGIALALDRSTLGDIAGRGVDLPGTTIVGAGVRGHATVTAGERLLGAAGAADRTRAVAELASGGWVRGPRLDLHYATTGSAPRIAAQVQADLAAVGVDVVLRPSTGAAFSKVGIGISPVRDDVELVLQGWMPDYSDPQSFHQLFTCANVDAGLNTSNFCSPEYDAAYAAATAFASTSSRMSAHAAVEDLLTGPSGLMPAVPLYEPVGEHLVQPWVRGFRQHASGRVDFERIGVLSH